MSTGTPPYMSFHELADAAARLTINEQLGLLSLIARRLSVTAIPRTTQLSAPPVCPPEGLGWPARGYGNHNAAAPFIPTHRILVNDQRGHDVTVLVRRHRPGYGLDAQGVEWKLFVDRGERDYRIERL